MSTATQDKTEALERNRRETFRMNDRIALCVRPLGEADYNHARTHIAASQRKQRILNSILASGDNQRGLLRNIRESEPAIASYLKSLEERLDALTQLLVVESHDTPDVPTHDVNISGNGLRFSHPQALPAGSHVALDLRLFPSRTCLSMFAVVVRSTEMKRPTKNGGRFTIAVDFCDVHEDDRELLIHHIHRLQLDYARRCALREPA
jgi:hypothetical protein